METIKTIILSVANEREYLPLKKEDFYKTYFTPETEYSAFNAALHELQADFAVAVSKKGKIISAREAGYVTGRFSQAKNGYGFLRVEGSEEDLFIPERYVGGIMNGDTAVATYECGRDRRAYGRIVKILHRGTERLMGTLVLRGRDSRHPSAYVIPDDPKMTFNVLVSPKNVGEGKNGDKVEVQIIAYPFEHGDFPRGKVVACYGDTFSKEANYVSILRTNGIPTEFSPAVTETADRAAAEPITPDGRLDLRDQVILTIDGADAKDLDDAVSLVRTEDGYRLGVHIADVSHYVTAGDPVDAEAMARGCSVYFVDQVVPMLPKSLSNGACSLNGGQDRYALSALMELDEEGNLRSVDLAKTLIRSTVRGVYDQVNDLFERGETSEFYEKYRAAYPTLTLMRELYEILVRRHAARGALDLETDEAKILLDETGFPVAIQPRERGEAEKLIEQFMLTANEAVASYLTDMAAPCVYRVHEEPAGEKLQEFALFAANLGVNITPLRAKRRTVSQLSAVLTDAREKGVGNVVSDRMLRAMMKARYSDVLSPHFGLAAERYCHFTSPIRRYPDLAVHRILHAILDGTADFDALGTFAHQAAVTSSENELRALTAEREIEALYKTMYMSRRVGEVLPVTVTSVLSFGLFAKTEELCEGMIPLSDFGGNASFDEESKTLFAGGRIYRAGDRLTVRVMEADIVSRRVTFSLAET
ncbi:MAG: ribonuclease R [Clostridia bacterium]|nr:ribonuclease R [Clostridia bacterium]